MNATRLAELESGLTGAARKVYEHIPLNEPWLGKDILASVKKAGIAVDRAHVDGCLNHLKARGLVRESKPGMWVRVSAKPRLVTIKESGMAPTEVSKDAKQSQRVTGHPDPFDRLINMARELRSLVQWAGDFANDLETATLEMQSRIESVSEDGKKLRQLQALLKGLE